MIAEFLKRDTNKLLVLWVGLLTAAMGFTFLSQWLPPELAAKVQAQLHEAIVYTGALIFTAIFGSKAENAARNYGVTTPPPHEKETPKT